MAEKFSKFRDAGTGIQVFLTPVVAGTASSSCSVGSFGWLIGLTFTPVFMLFGIIRSVLGGLFWSVYLVTSSTALLRMVLFIIGFVALPVEYVSSGVSGRKIKTIVGGKTVDAKKGDLVISNHSSWIDLLILSYLFPGIKFAVPVIPEGAGDVEVAKLQSKAQGEGGLGGKRTPKKNGMSANTRMVTPNSNSNSSTLQINNNNNVKSTTGSESSEIPIVGYTLLTLTKALRFVGGMPPSKTQLGQGTRVYTNLDEAMKNESLGESSSSSPLALFPEVVTSNGRALLNIAPTSLGLNPHWSLNRIHIVTIKYGSPTPTCPTSVFSVSNLTSWKNIFSHLIRILFFSSPVRVVSIRRMMITKFDLSIEHEGWKEQVVEFMSSMARLKRTGIHWWEKKDFLKMIASRRQ
ncbi:uncharacterized protein MEPE_04056 [Melanopsichium pennsylvanicum]|uniref:Phospholipid/glycerol acyltransferase domain-containing protein n=1 Tax=Melanopsichium pennsylvanicum TaxID=63383 RepID=A0AAJ4XP56_9BASI|nr:uncharacterized protein MEPE_04056 [Melanopsichium pennsylvanicum]